MQHRLGQNVPLIVRGSWEAEGEMVSHRKVRRTGCLLTSHISQCVYRQQQNLQPLLPNQSRVQDCFLPGRTNHPQKRWFGICFCGETAKKMKNLTLGLFLLPAISAWWKTREEMRFTVSFTFMSSRYEEMIDIIHYMFCFTGRCGLSTVSPKGNLEQTYIKLFVSFTAWIILMSSKPLLH